MPTPKESSKVLTLIFHFGRKKPFFFLTFREIICYEITHVVLNNLLGEQSWHFVGLFNHFSWRKCNNIIVMAIEMEVSELPTGRTLYKENFGYKRVKAFLLNL